jgi:hypothetical protein
MGIIVLLANGYVDNFDVFFRLLLVYPGILDFVNNIKPLISPSKYGMLPVQPKSLLSSDEKLRAIGIRTRVRHTDGVWFVVF